MRSRGFLLLPLLLVCVVVVACSSSTTSRVVPIVSCTGNPVTDTAGLAAGLASAERVHGILAITSGTCALNANLVVRKAVTIEGRGGALSPDTPATDLVQHARANIFQIDAPGVTVEWLTLDTATYNTTAPVLKNPDPGVLYSSQSDTTVRDVVLYAGSGFGMRLVGPSPCRSDVTSGDVVANVNATTTGTGGFVSVDVDCQTGAKLSGLTVHGGAVGLYQDSNTTLTGEKFTPGAASITCAPPWFVTGPSTGMTVSDVTSAGGHGREINSPVVTVTGQTVSGVGCNR